MTDGAMWNSLADALDADSIANDWAAFSTADGTVHADWVVTLPGQYVMTNPVCDTTRATLKRPLLRLRFVMVLQHKLRQDAAGLARFEAAYSAAGGDDRNQLPCCCV